MEPKEGFIEFSGYLWESIRDTKPEDISEPIHPIGPMDTVLGQMLEIEKILFTLREEFFSALIHLFKVDAQNPEAILEFYTWIFCVKRDEFIITCQEEGYDVTMFLETRKQFFDAHDLLMITTAQHFGIDREEFTFYYRKNFIVAVQKLNLFQTNDN